MIGIVIPAHNEEALLGDSLAAVLAAARHPDLGGEPVEIVVVLDACTDASAEIASAYGVSCLAVEVRNVGRARRRGAEWLLARGARWLAFTDADSVVAADWLPCQLKLKADAVCGSVTVRDWGAHSAEVRARFDAGYRDRDGHRHVHGTNFGVSRAAYLAVGGFAPLAVGEDVALAAALERAGFAIAWSAAPRVATSARLVARARGGFGDFIDGLYRVGASAVDTSAQALGSAAAQAETAE